MHRKEKQGGLVGSKGSMTMGSDTNSGSLVQRAPHQGSLFVTASLSVRQVDSFASQHMTSRSLAVEQHQAEEAETIIWNSRRRG